MIKQVFWIDKERFVCELVSSALKTKNIACYTHQEPDNFQFLIEDMQPEALVVDLATISESPNDFFKSLAKGQVSSKTPLIVLGSNEEYESIKAFGPNIRGHITKPISPMDIGDQISVILKKI
ncbi:MAG: hypothetical protein JNM93_07315 [Bacteriovoracaceae bacterium]|nr:hypothetical protein [Bacteriovoracaceae bacterium]